MISSLALRRSSIACATKTLASLSLALAALATLVAADLQAQPAKQTSQTNQTDKPASNVALSFETDGQATLQNALINVKLSPEVSLSQGILSWVFKPINAQSIDVLYGQTDYLKGHVMGQRWDPVTIIGYQPATPKVGGSFAPVKQGASKDGSAIMLEQIASDTSTLTRQVIIRRDLTTLEFRHKLTNISAAPYAASLRYHSVLSPGSIDGRQNQNETIFMPTQDGVLQLDQSLSRFVFDERFKGQKFFNTSWENEPARSWVRGKQPTALLTDNWAAQVGTNNGKGMVMIAQPQTFVGFYNALGATLEPMYKAFKLSPGESWETQNYVATFSGLSPAFKDGSITRATVLYVATQNINSENNKLTGKLIPLFKGTLRGVELSGKKKTFVELPADPTIVLDLKADLAAGKWQLEAIDTQGKRIGVIASDGSATLDEVTFIDHTPALPVMNKLAENVSVGKAMQNQIAPFLADRDFVIYCDWHAQDALKEQAKRMANILGVGVIWTKPDTKAIVLGDPTNSSVVKQVGQFKHSISQAWPGKNKGVVLAYDSLEFTQAPALVIAGSDASGALLAAKAFEQAYLKDIKKPEGFVLWAASPALKVQPYTPAGKRANKPLSLAMAKGEYEPAQMVLTSYEALKDIDVKLAPLVHSETGKTMSSRYITRYRKLRGPLWLRWVNYFPLDRKDGWTGMPDPLLDYPVKQLPANTSQGLWLTVIVPEDAEPGLYKSTVTLTANGQSQQIPLEVNVWDFTLPRTGIQGEPYMSINSAPPDANRRMKPYYVERLIQNLAEHGMRIFTLDADGLVKWHFDEAGGFKGKDMPWLVVSEDGKIAMDVSGMAAQMEQIAKAAKPFEVSYRLSINDLVGWPYDLTNFRRAFPDRFKDMPDRKGHLYQSYYSQEMMSMLRTWLVSTNQLDQFVLKIGDEPRSFQWWWDELTVGAREAKLPFVTALNAVSWPEVEQALGSSMAWIQPLYMHYDQPFFDKARKAGMKISWYNCGPPPQNIATTSASELRSYIWQGAKADLDIISWWGVQNWNHHGHHDVWFNRYSHWNSMIYPQHPNIKPWRTGAMLHDAGPIDTQRWEHIRDGMEDAAYVKLLHEKIAQARKDNRTKEADEAQAVLDKIWHDLYPTHAEYRPPFADMMAARTRVAEAIVKLSHQPKVAQSPKK